MWRVFAVLTVVLILSGCLLTGDREEAANHYVRELASLLDTEVHFSTIPTVTALPRMRERRLDLPDLEMGVVDFLSLYGCELQVVVGERTSVLGRVAHPGTRMEYHVRFIDAARDCLPKIDSEARSKTVRDAMKTKTESLPSALWNGIWATGEIQSFFTRTGGTLPPVLDAASFRQAQDHAARTLAMIRKLRRGETSGRLQRIGSVYEHWQSQPLMGQLLRSAVALTTRLEDATALIHERLGSATTCPDDGYVYREFFRSRYVDGLAERLRFVRQQQARLVPLFRRLIDAPGVAVPEGMTRFVRHNLEPADADSVWYRLDAAMLRHMVTWNRLIKECAG